MARDRDKRKKRETNGDRRRETKKRRSNEHSSDLFRLKRLQISELYYPVAFSRGDRVSLTWAQKRSGYETKRGDTTSKSIIKTVSWIQESKRDQF